MRKLAALGVCLLMAGPAMAGFTATNAGPINSDGAFGSPANGFFTYDYAGPDFDFGDIIFNGIATSGDVGSYLTELRVNITDPLGSTAGWYPFSSGTTWTGPMPVVDQTVTGGGAFFTGTAGTWTFSFSESYDDPGVDAYWTDLSFEILDTPPPPVCWWGETFDNGIPADWTLVDNSGNGGWQGSDVFGKGNLTGGTGQSASVDSDFYGFVDIDAEMITPEIADLPADAELSFKHAFNSYTGTEVADLDISVNGGAFTNLASYNTNTTGTVTFDLSAYAGDTIQLRWHYYNANYDWYWQVDDVCITPEPSSLALLGLGVVALLRRR